MPGVCALKAWNRRGSGTIDDRMRWRFQVGFFLFHHCSGRVSLSVLFIAYKAGKPEPTEPGYLTDRWDSKQIFILPSHTCHTPWVILQLKKKMLESLEKSGIGVGERTCINQKLK